MPAVRAAAMRQNGEIVMNFKFKPKGVCSMEIKLDIADNDTINKIEFVGGCSGNTQGVAKLAEGRKVDEVINLLSGIKCGFKNTSCPDQLASALKEYKSNK